MTTLLYANFATSTLAFPLLPTSTTAVLATGTGASFPQPAAGEGFYLTLQSASNGLNFEIVLVTSILGDNILAMQRAQQGTTAQSWAVGDIAAQYNTAGDMQQFIQNSAGSYVSDVTATAPILSSGGATPDISIPAATASVDGYLTKDDWALFNSKGNGTVTGVTGTYPVISSGGDTPAISMHVADLTHDGYLSAADWARFDSGVNEGVNTISIVNSHGFSGTVTSGNSAAITLNTTISGMLKGNGTSILAAQSGVDYAPATSGTSILIGDGSGGFSSLSLGSGLNYASGSLSNSGLLSATATGTVNGITLSRTITNGVADFVLGGQLGSVSLTSQVAGTLPISNGGTNSTATPVAGGIAYGNGTGYAFTTAGSAGQVLTSNGSGVPYWATGGGGGGGTITDIYVTSPLQTTGGTTPQLSMPAATASVSGYLTSTDWARFNANSGTVSSVSVVTANGFSGSVTSTSTPAITLSTTVGTSLAPALLKGNGSQIVAAVSGTDYAPATSGGALLRGNNLGGFQNVNTGVGLAFSGNTLRTNTSGSSILYGDGAGGFSNVTIGSGLNFVAGTLTATGGGSGGGNVSTSGLPLQNYVSKFTSADTISNSVIYDDGSNVGIGKVPSTKLDVAGVISSNNNIQTTAGRFLGTGAGSGTTFGRGNLLDLTVDNQNSYSMVLRNLAAGDNFGLALQIDDTGNINLFQRSFGNTNSWITYNSATSSTSIYSANVERLRFNANGAWNVNGNLYGNIGQVLTSQGANSPPIWSSAGGGGSGTVTTSGTPTAGYLAKFTDTTIIGNSVLYADSTGVGINNTSLGGDALRVTGNTTLGTASGNTTTIAGVLTASNSVNLGSSSVVSQIITLLNQLSANGSVGAAGQILQSQGANLPPKWGAVTVTIRNQSAANYAALTNGWTSNGYDQLNLTAQTGTISVGADYDAGANVLNGQKFTFRITGGTGGCTITFQTASNYTFANYSGLLPSSLVLTANQTVYVGCIYNSTTLRWDVVSQALST